MPSTPPRALTRAVAIAALAVLVLGLQRMLVLCTHDGITSLAFAHPVGACCADPDHPTLRPDTAAPGDQDDQPRQGRFDDCEHSELAVELAPAPRPAADGATDPLPPCGAMPGWLPLPPSAWAAPPRPAATGPPRPDGRTALRATMLLLV